MTIARSELGHCDPVVQDKCEVQQAWVPLQLSDQQRADDSMVTLASRPPVTAVKLGGRDVQEKAGAAVDLETLLADRSGGLARAMLLPLQRLLHREAGVMSCDLPA